LVSRAWQVGAKEKNERAQKLRKKAGFPAHVTKPISFDQLHQELEQFARAD
jgi:CheY-like chemotaxis protein